MQDIYYCPLCGAECRPGVPSCPDFDLEDATWGSDLKNEEVNQMLIEKTGKLARTVNGLRPINILKHQKVDEDCYPVFDADDNPIWDGYEVAAVDAVGAPQIRIFGKFETLKEAQHFAKTLPNTVD